MCHFPEAELKETAGAPGIEIDVTPAMVEAGYDVMRGSDWHDDTLDERKELLVHLFKAMLSASWFSKGDHS